MWCMSCGACSLRGQFAEGYEGGHRSAGAHDVLEMCALWWWWWRCGHGGGGGRGDGWQVLQEEATFIAASPSGARFVEQAWTCTLSADGTCVLPGVLSRKKQIIPTLEMAPTASLDNKREAVAVSPGAAAAQAPVRA